MTDLIDYFKEPWAGTVIGLLLAEAIRFFLKRKYPQMARWKVSAVIIGITLTALAAYLGYFYFISPLFDNRGFPTARVEWRTEIRQADEPETWPFKEPRYMLSCLGEHGDYSVYLVKVEDISFRSPRARNFRPQYYGLKGSWFGWKKGETQLLDGQSSKVFTKYVDYSLSLCKNAEARTDSNLKKAPVEKK